MKNDEQDLLRKVYHLRIIVQWIWPQNTWKNLAQLSGGKLKGSSKMDTTLFSLKDIEELGPIKAVCSMCEYFNLKVGLLKGLAFW